MAHLLIVEDDELLRDALQAQLGHAGYTLSVASDGEQAQQILLAQRFDAVVLDLGLPGIDGLQVLRWIRQRLAALPVLILTARDGLDDRVQGLNEGADDYLTKPFDLAELLARLQAMLRRARLPAFGGSLQVQAPGAARLRLDPDKPLAWLDEQALDVTHREWSLLRLLLDNMGQVISREDVLTVWQTVPSEGATGSNALEVYIHRLRRKLQDSGLNIRNVRGLGYLLETTP
ncbi:response regulator transcription factor [Curvibacter sp. CHRR-16]|uniref:response regulator transcription factor n=1 Tax=Curvibacter sp. CHRR-16 TaxID=2835872 RepID=UPI001BDA39F8|nr:response regulator transcription factor [Curvibacter sp. CHRR-16]MBT0570926.1 response regulator transcription factor [Curvibacter sp. CHRR-16]